MKKCILNGGVILGIVIMLLFTSISPNSRGKDSTSQQQIIASTSPTVTQKTASFILYIIGKNSLEKQETVLPASSAKRIYEIYQQLQKEMTSNPLSEQTKQLKQEFIDLLQESHVLPAEISQSYLQNLLQLPTLPLFPSHRNPLPFPSKASEWFCNFVTTGQGAAFPIIILPRFIPFILTPIPRAFVLWSTRLGVTSAGGLISHTGFIASGQQQGIALGFWGIGFSIFLPPIDAYGIFGYAVYTKVTAEIIDYYPPNSPPEITQTDPADGEQMVPMSTTELRFSINDANGDLMSYNVTTDPDIGSGSGGLKPNGVYSIPVSGLQELTTYTWNIQVTDGKDTVEKIVAFTTEPIAPVISNPVPSDGEREVPMDIQYLQFTLKDYQGDIMEYSVQTQPNIGSAHVTGVHDGTYSVSVHGLIYGTFYRWFVNVTDGTHTTNKIFTFQTGYPHFFNPFEWGWQYRKKITVDHTMVADNLENFPVLISTIDSDLMKAQTDGDDILFMNGAGNAGKLRHEIESIDTSLGKLVSWVNVTTLSANDDTIIYLYYGNPNCTNQEYPEKTWDAHYTAVWHMNDATPSKISDSTIHKVVGTKKAPNTPAEWNGKVAKGQLFNRSATVWQYITMGDLEVFEYSGDFTLSAWIYPNTAENMKVVGKHQEFSGNYKGYALNWNLGPEQKMSLRVDGGGYNYQYMYANENKPSNNWYYMSGLKQSGTNYLYINGMQQSQTGSQTLINSDYPFCIGAWRTDGAYANFYGIIDEVRVSNIGRSSAWIQTEYNTINDPAQFITVGPEESGL